MTEQRLESIFKRLSQSTFRQRIALNSKDYLYLQSKGKDLITLHAIDFIKERLAPTDPHNDGKQTPWRGHPVFVAQHATATCCRSCLAKWHFINQGVDLTSEQQDYIVKVIMHWLHLAKPRPSKAASRNLCLL